MDGISLCLITWTNSVALQTVLQKLFLLISMVNYAENTRLIFTQENAYHKDEG